MTAPGEPSNTPLRRTTDSLAALGHALAAERLYRWADEELRVGGSCLFLEMSRRDPVQLRRHMLVWLAAFVGIVCPGGCGKPAATPNVTLRALPSGQVCVGDRLCTEIGQKRSLTIEPGEHQLTVICAVQGKPIPIRVGLLQVRRSATLLDEPGAFFFAKQPSSATDCSAATA
jgi:hypothetical protein